MRSGLQPRIEQRENQRGKLHLLALRLRLNSEPKRHGNPVEQVPPEPLRRRSELGRIAAALEVLALRHAGECSRGHAQTAGRSQPSGSTTRRSVKRRTKVGAFVSRITRSACFSVPRWPLY